MKIRVFKTTNVLEQVALDEFLKNPNITVIEIHTAAAGTMQYSEHFVTIVYRKEGESE
jgi:hypothetical protein